MGLAGISSLLSNWSAAAHGNRLVAKTSAGRFRVGYIGSKFIKVKRKYNIIEGKYKKVYFFSEDNLHIIFLACIIRWYHISSYFLSHRTFECKNREVWSRIGF